MPMQDLIYFSLEPLYIDVRWVFFNQTKQNYGIGPQFMSGLWSRMVLEPEPLEEKKHEPGSLPQKTRGGAAKTMRLLHRLLEDKNHKIFFFSCSRH